jgi:hypothetical protein
MKRAAALMIAVALLGGCGPSLRGLVTAKHYREAICAAHDGSEAEQKTVLRALNEDAGIHVHVHVLSADELRPVLGDSTGAVSKRAQLARVRAQSNALPIDQLTLDVSWKTARGEIAALPVAWESLALATREKLPPRRKVSTYLTGWNLLKLGGAIFTGGLSLPFTEFNAEIVEVDAPLHEYQESAPLASALLASMPSGGCRRPRTTAAGADPPGQICDWYFVIDQLSGAPIELEVRSRYTAMRRGGDLSDTTERGLKKRCYVERASRISLGETRTLTETSRAMFGARMAPLGEVAVSR